MIKGIPDPLDPDSSSSFPPSTCDGPVALKGVDLGRLHFRCQLCGTVFPVDPVSPPRIVSRFQPKTFGKMADRGRRKAGIEAHKMPRLDSMIVHMEDGMLFQVVSRWEVAMSRVVMRRMEVMQTL